MAAKMKWGDVDEDDVADDAKLQSLPVASLPSATKELPQRKVETSADGIKTVTEYHLNGEGKRIKTVTKYRVVKTKTRMKNGVQERKKWAKFGKVKGKPPGPEDNITYSDNQIYTLDLTAGTKKKEEKSVAQLLAESKSSVVVCRHCGETGHWTLKCPKRAQAAPLGQRAEDVAPLPTEMLQRQQAGGGGVGGRYVPPSKRAGARGGFGEMMGRDDTAGIRVTNLSEETTEDDLRELFRPFGHTTRVFLAKDRNTGLSRGFAFINYDRRDSAEAAIKGLHGHGYDNLILHVEWAKPREERPAQ